LIVPNIYGGGSAGRLISDDSKFAEKATEIGYPEDRALEFANELAYWGTNQTLQGQFIWVQSFASCAYSPWYF